MAYWMGRLGFQGLQGENLAAISSRMRGNRSLRNGGRSRLNLQARASGIRKSHPKEHQLQRTLAVDSQNVSCRLFTSSEKDGDTADEADGIVRPSKVSQQSLPLLGKAWRRSLSPLERLSRMVPEELLSGEVRALRSLEVKENEAGAIEEGPFPLTGTFPQADFQLDQGSLSEKTESAPSRNCPFRIGELVLIEARRKYGMEFKNLCVLNSTGTYNNELGFIRFSEIIGKVSGQMFQTSQGHLLIIRRPALEEYVLLMSRGPTIIYPKDANTILLLMDITQGDTVLEAGSGSGSMSLFLSRAVGSQGRLISYEIRKDYHKLAKKNYWKWRNTWKIGHSEEWPDNVDFINQDILTAVDDLKSVTLDACLGLWHVGKRDEFGIRTLVNLLQIIDPCFGLHVWESIASRHCITEKQEAAINSLDKQSRKNNTSIKEQFKKRISQLRLVIELIEAIRISKFALFCEKIVEVTHRDWLIYPAKWKKTDFLKNVAFNLNMDDETAAHCEEVSAEERRNNASVSANAKPHYIARPFPYQVSHTAFLIKLRKFNLICPNTSANGICQFEDQTSSEITN